MQSWNLTSSTTVQVQVLNFHTDLHLPAMMFVCVCVCVNVCVCVSVCVCVCVNCYKFLLWSSSRCYLFENYFKITDERQLNHWLGHQIMHATNGDRYLAKRVQPEKSHSLSDGQTFIVCKSLFKKHTTVSFLLISQLFVRWYWECILGRLT